jgi:hypothetical protein
MTGGSRRIVRESRQIRVRRGRVVGEIAELPKTMGASQQVWTDARLALEARADLCVEHDFRWLQSKTHCSNIFNHRRPACLSLVIVRSVN